MTKVIKVCRNVYSHVEVAIQLRPLIEMGLFQGRSMCIEAIWATHWLLWIPFCRANCSSTFMKIYFLATSSHKSISINKTTHHHGHQSSKSLHHSGCSACPHRNLLESEYLPCHLFHKTCKFPSYISTF